ncbi:hypothetical protein PHJA_000871000 [Phtheirospermum japonicum]|uniref:Retrotransposon Copia-like N-terminal domain-containing protein n=1 Tax=Phtheirospermum japonicum TaxID=374723 RepID=A0A830BTE8_9LAMI|nr:hypothetical protein PHJA_000871000 [Phtheirospermum japonicum]
MATNPATNFVQLNVPIHFPIKLTSANFRVWSRQIQSTIIGFDLVGYIDGTQKVPSQFSDTAQQVVNPEYLLWFRQDQILTSALLGSCSDTIQPIISSAQTACDAWKHLTMSYANTSRGRVVSLKAKLAKNLKGKKSVIEFLREMRAIVDDLALAQTHICHTTLPTSRHDLSLTNGLCAPQLRTNLISIYKLCKSNHVSVKFFSSYFLVKDLCTGMSLMHGQNIHDVYCVPSSCPPQINVIKLPLYSLVLSNGPAHGLPKNGAGAGQPIFSQVGKIYVCSPCTGWSVFFSL